MKMPEAKAGVVPELRFPEFRDAGPWEVKRLGEAGRILTGKTPRTGDRESWNGEIPWITPTDIADAKRIATSARRLTKKGATAAGLLPKNTVLVTCIASIGKNAILDAPGSCNQQINAIIPKNDYDADFIFYLIERNRLAMMNLAGGSSPAIIPKSEFEKLRLPFPDLPEQQQIADCLTSLDDLIRAEEGRLAALRAHKTGLMQRLFPAPGQTAPRLRFPEFRDAGPWEVKLLGEIYRFKPTNSWPRDRLKYEGGTIKNIHYGDIHKGLSSTFRIADEVVPFLDEGLTAAISEEALCGPSDIVFADASEDVADIGKAIEIVDIGDEKLVSGLHTILASQIDRKLIIGFGAYLFASAGIRAQIQQRAQGAKVLGISKSQLAEITLAYPKHEPEQQKIADCLTALDDLIRAQGETIAALKAHKTALMQKLFPREVG